MCAATTRPVAEPTPVPEIFVTHVGKIEHIGNIVRIWLCAPETLAGCEADGQISVAKVKLLVPKSSVSAGIADLITNEPGSVTEAGPEVRRVPN